MATAVDQQALPEHFSVSIVSERVKNNVDDDIAHGTSVLLTPDSTPTKQSQSSSPPTPPELDEPPIILRISKSSSTNPGTKAFLSRSQVESQLDSPKPTRCKITRSDLQSKQSDSSQTPVSSPSTPSKAGKKGKGRTGKPRKAANKNTTVSCKDSSETKSKKVIASKAAPKSGSGTKSLPGNRKSIESNSLVTDYFPIRRSSRVPSKHLKQQRADELEELILSGCEDGLEVVQFEGKGRGVVSTKPFKRGDFVVEYRGDLTNHAVAKRREESYSENSDLGCYMYYFNFRNKSYCVDATSESPYLGRLLNHCKSNGNCMTKVVGINDEPYLILVAARDISVGEELTYDYGDRSKEAIAAHPWLAW